MQRQRNLLLPAIVLVAAIGVIFGVMVVGSNGLLMPPPTLTPSPTATPTPPPTSPPPTLTPTATPTPTPTLTPTPLPTATPTPLPLVLYSTAFEPGKEIPGRSEALFGRNSSRFGIGNPNIRFIQFGPKLFNGLLRLG